MKRTLYLVVLMMAMALMLAPPPATVTAQDDLKKTYVAEDGSFTFRYPASWTVEEDAGTVYVSNDRASIAFAGPTVMRELDLDTVASPTLLAGVLADSLEIEGELSRADFNGRPSARYDFVDTSGYSSFVLVVTFRDGSLGFIVVQYWGGYLPSTEQTVLAIAATFDVPGEGAAPVTSSGAPDRLQDYAGSWQEAVAELRDVGLIPFGGNLVFLEDRAYFAGQGAFYTPLGRSSPATDIVMAGELTFTIGSAADYEDCTLGARVVLGTGTAVAAYLDVGLNSSGYVFYFDYTGVEETSLADERPLADATMRPHHILLLALGDRLTVYVDGRLVFENALVEERSGIYGVGLTGRGPAASCVGRNIWVYQVPAGRPGECRVQVTRNVNRRSGPGTRYDTVGQLTPGETPTVLSYIEGGDGFRWWQLEDESWVREDVVEVVGDCAAVPEFEGAGGGQQEAVLPGTAVARR